MTEKKKKEKKAETHICHVCEEVIYPEDEQEYVETRRNTKMWFHRNCIMAVIRSIRGGTAGLNEEDRLQIARLLIKAGYSVRIGYQVIPGNAKGKKEYVIEYWEEE